MIREEKDSNLNRKKKNIKLLNDLVSTEIFYILVNIFYFVIYFKKTLIRWIKEKFNNKSKKN